jgi:hypothetical protein
MKFNRLLINANDTVMTATGILWPIALIACCSVVGLKSNLHKQLPKATLSPISFMWAFVGWTLVQQVKWNLTVFGINANDKTIPFSDVFWPITLMARYTVVGLKSDLQNNRQTVRYHP